MRRSKSLKNKEGKQWKKMEKIGMNHCWSCPAEESCFSKPLPYRKAGTTDVEDDRKLRNKLQLQIYKQIYKQKKKQFIFPNLAYQTSASP